jgi:hypothetical protein
MSGLRRGGLQLFTYTTTLVYFTYQLSYPIAAERAPPFSTTQPIPAIDLIRIPTYCTYYEYCLSTILPTAANLAKPLSACKKKKIFKGKLIYLFLEYSVVPFICTLGEFCGLLQLN